MQPFFVQLPYIVLDSSINDQIDLIASLRAVGLWTEIAGIVHNLILSNYIFTV